MEDDFYDGCAFCRIASTENGDRPEYDRPIVETKDFLVIPALGQLTPGYLLICSREHHINLGVLEPESFSLLIGLKEQIRSVLMEEYGRGVVFFEHGPAAFNLRAGSCIEHAHLHAISMDLMEPPPYVADVLEGEPITDVSRIPEFGHSKTPYFFLECSNRSMYLYKVPLLPCQYGRQVIARALAVPEKWDWRTHPYYTETAETGYRLRARIESKDDVCHTSVLRATG